MYVQCVKDIINCSRPKDMSSGMLRSVDPYLVTDVSWTA
jgi:hypothetical protein